MEPALTLTLPEITPSNAFEAVGSPRALPRRKLRLTPHPELGCLHFANPFTVGELSHRHSWLSYREPEGHLADLTKRLLPLLATEGVTAVKGLTWKDESLVGALSTELESHGLVFARSDDLLGVGDTSSSNVLDSALVGELVTMKSFPPVDADVFVARHILEHAVDPLAFVASLVASLPDTALLVIEVPNAANDVIRGRYSMIWEEHVTYFTPGALTKLADILTLTVLDIQEYTSDGEDIVVLVAKKSADQRQHERSSSDQSPDSVMVADYFSKFVKSLEQFHAFLAKSKFFERDLFIFGANHVASNFIDLYVPSAQRVVCIDDMPQKHGRTLSTRRAPIQSAHHLQEAQPEMVLSAVHPGRSAAVHHRLYSMLGNDTELHSLYDLMSFRA